MAAVHTNGINGHGPTVPLRFSHVPRAISVVLPEADGTIDVEIPLDEDIQDDPTDLCTLLENENESKNTWMVVALGYAKQGKIDVAIEILSRAIGALARGRADDRLSVLNGLCWLYLLKCRESPRIKPDGVLASEAKTKEFYINAATSVLNDASRISPSYPPLFLARGVLYLLRASLAAFTASTASTQTNSERLEMLRQAAQCFEDALRSSTGKNLLALMGKAKVNYSLGKYAEALKAYQTVLERSPDTIDPDPRIGIGCCFWQLGFKDDAAAAWKRSLELNPNSKIALILLGTYNLHLSSQYPTSDPNFAEVYKRAMTQHTVPAFKLDDKYPITCSTLGGYYLMRRGFDKVENLARRAIELTDVTAIASDGWYLLARKEHYGDEISKANEFYARADQARGGDERGYIPAKFGAAQMRVLMQDYDGAKFRLEKILQQDPKNIEAQTLLGTLYAEDVFAAQAAKTKEDKSSELKKARTFLENVTKASHDPNKKITPDSSVLMNLARLLETDHPDKSLKYLEEVEQLELNEIPEEDRPEGIDNEDQLKTALREFLPPQLLNNMACFHYQAERYAQARELFQTALNACVKVGDKDPSIDTDALVTTISYNLARTYESEGMTDEAKSVYEGLLSRHADYIEARIRLAYITLRQSPTDEGPKTIANLLKENPSNLEVRALYGWYTNKSKKRTQNAADDQEQKHYKYTLQQFDKHDRYSLTGLGNIWLAIAREMRRDTELDKEKRHKMYEKAVEFFDKALQLDPRNAYAAQGIAIALVEDKKDHGTAIQMLTKVRETMKDFSVFVNLGHTYCELKQYSRAIENYEAALAKDKQRDPQILACLGRVWLMRGKQEKSVQAMKTSLEYSRRALEVAADQVHFKFNVAFVQIQIAQLMHTLPDEKRTLAEVEAAAAGLDEAIESFTAIARLPNPPFPKNDIEQRANMGRNTMRRQLERAIQSQREYEERNASKLQAARAAREAEIRRREEEKRKAEEEVAERKRKIAEERQKAEERDRELLEKRAEDARKRQEWIEEEEQRKITRSEKRGKGGKRKKKSGSDIDDSDAEIGDSDGAERPKKSRRKKAATGSGTEGDSEEERPRQKKRKLERKSKASSKFKSADIIEDSDEELEADLPASGGDEESAGEDEAPVPKARKAARVIDDEDEDEDEINGATPPAANGDGDIDMDEDDE